MRKFLNACIDVAIVPALVALIIGAVVIPTAVVSNWMTYTSAAVEIEQLRTDMQNVSAQRSEDVVGQATGWNQAIMRHRRWNRVPVVCLVIPNGWDHIEPIGMPKD
jgi:hypothetical protein